MTKKPFPMLHSYSIKTGYKKNLQFLSSFGILLVITAFFSTRLAAQPNYIVNSNADAVAVNLVTGETATPGVITLRSAIQAATAQPGAHIITFSGAVVSPINLSLGQITVGNAANGNNITINGPGKTLLTINQTTQNRVFSTGTGAVSFTLTDLTLNYSGPLTATSMITGGGGAIIAGGNGANTVFTNIAVTNFKIQAGNGGGISVSSGASVHHLAVTNCDFINNYSGGAGGALSYNGLGTCTISSSTFSGNQTGPIGTAPGPVNTGGDGGNCPRV